MNESEIKHWQMIEANGFLCQALCQARLGSLLLGGEDVGGTNRKFTPKDDVRIISRIHKNTNNAASPVAPFDFGFYQDGHSSSYRPYYTPMKQRGAEPK